MSKQLILITAPFNCGYCATAKKNLPSICEGSGFELIEMEDEKTGNKEEDLPVDLYPTIMVRVNNEMKHLFKGYNEDNIKKFLKKY